MAEQKDIGIPSPQSVAAAAFANGGNKHCGIPETALRLSRPTLVFVYAHQHLSIGRRRGDYAGFHHEQPSVSSPSRQSHRDSRAELTKCRMPAIYGESWHGLVTARYSRRHGKAASTGTVVVPVSRRRRCSFHYRQSRSWSPSSSIRWLTSALNWRKHNSRLARMRMVVSKGSSFGGMLAVASMNNSGS